MFCGDCVPVGYDCFTCVGGACDGYVKTCQQTGIAFADKEREVFNRYGAIVSNRDFNRCSVAGSDVC